MIQLYACERVPKKVPEFVDPHVTVERLGGRTTYIIEVDLKHPSVLAIKDIADLLQSFGFVNPALFYTGKKPNFTQ